MGSVFKRGDSKFWWVAFKDVTGKWRNASSEEIDEKEAKRFLKMLERKVAAEIEAGVTPSSGPMTVKRYADKWITERRQRGIASVDDDETRIEHAMPFIGHLELASVRRVHMRDLVRDLTALRKKTKGSTEPRFAPRTVLHVYAVLRVMFSDAVMEELIDATPCTLKQRLKELPKKLDKNPLWRSTANYTRDEVEQLISDQRIPHFRRMLYAIEFLTGMRANEITVRRWRDYDPDAQPLGRLTVGSSYNLKKKLEKAATKTGITREVPVHPTLAKLLAEWKLSGWTAHVGRDPKPEDFIVPNEAGEVLSSTSALKRLHEHLDLLGLRRRRQHDARRTFISLGIGDGARKDLLRWITHGPEGGDIMDVYTKPPWHALCEEVSKLKIHPLAGAVLPIVSTDFLRSV